jgi:SAM-dependent methyltransferase
MNDGRHPDPAAYASRLAEENRIYRDDTDVHSLPGIFHYWSNRYVRPKLEAFGFSTPEGMFRKYLGDQLERDPSRPKRFVSFGSGNCDMEIALALDLRAHRHLDYVIDCVDLNPAMLERGRASAAERELTAHLDFVQADFNQWAPEHEYDSVIANQALNHVLNLEGLVAQIKSSLRPHGTLILSEVVGRNGHQRWPEALRIVHEFWRKLPPSYRFNRKLQRYEEMYRNYDCSGDGFEGIRSQDILPLLLENFHFQVFVAFANVIEPFVDRAFGPNFDSDAPWDRSFIDAVQQRDEEEFAAGRLKPTHILAVLGKDPTVPTLFHPPLTPESSVRNPQQVAGEPEGLSNPYEWQAWPHSPPAELGIAQLQQLNQELEKQTVLLRQLQEQLDQMKAELEERTAWALDLESQLAARATETFILNVAHEEQTQELEERTKWAFKLDRQLTARNKEMANLLDQLAWAFPLDRRFHKALSTAVRALSRIRKTLGLGAGG